MEANEIIDSLIDYSLEYLNSSKDIGGKNIYKLNEFIDNLDDVKNWLKKASVDIEKKCCAYNDSNDEIFNSNNYNANDLYDLGFCDNPVYDRIIEECNLINSDK